ncbi:MAG: family 78 glycoside hydrolase catalytic domain [Oscillospiraceae bacterium]|nr:family 78 glycoside hydrolase catalytic domain [Oscillospiraceae bacterium]
MALSNAWITSGAKTPCYLRKEFSIDKAVAAATVRVCGLGQFNFYLNGRRVGENVLDPGWTDYNKAAQYLSFDVSEYLRPGKNALGLELGNGWYLWDTDFGYGFHFPPFMPPNPNPYKPYGESLVAALELEISYADGSRETIISDESFSSAPHGVRHSNVYGSEEIDGKALLRDFSAPDFDASGWTPARRATAAEAPKGKLVPQTQPPVRVVKRYAAKKIGKANGRVIYDLGQNISGLLYCEVRGRAGTRVDFYPAEKLTPEGDADQMAKNWLPIDNVISYTIAADGSWESVTQYFTYFSGRYIAVAGDAEVRALRGDAITSAWKRAGSFRCDDERFNKIYDMIEKTVEANLLSVHTDCPTIERFAWQEPNHLMAPSIFYMKDVKALWEKILADLRLAQHTEKDFFLDMEGKPFPAGAGLVPSQAPCYIPNVLPVPGLGSFYDIIPWGSTCILGAYWHYLFYGDLGIVRDNYETGLRYLDYLKTKRGAEGFLNHGLGDWGHPEGHLARENVETAFLYADAATLAKFARWLGKDAEAEALDAFADEVRRNYNEKLLVYSPELGCRCYRAWDHPGEIFTTQTAEALPLYFGLVPPDAEAEVTKAFRAALDAKGAFVAGEVGLPYVIQTARKNGWNELICRFITREAHPSYYAFVLDGETTLGEYWETNPRSHCHDMMGHIIEWYYNGLAGIEPLEPGFAKVSVHPYLPEAMNRFDCSYETPRGAIRVAASRDADGARRFEITVPPGIMLA